VPFALPKNFGIERGTSNLALRTDLGSPSKTPNEFGAQKVRHQPLA
jgi:hypothetical protein